MNENFAISVIVTTYNRSEILPETLDCLAKQSLDAGDYEVLVVDDGSPDDTEQVVNSLKESLPFRLRYMRHDNSGPGFSQNRGIREASSDLVCLIADDILLCPDALQAHVNGHATNPAREVAILGKVVQSPELVKESVFLANWDPFKFQLLDAHGELPYYFFWACNISFKKDFMLEHGMFLEPMGRAGAAAHEDVELGCRLHRNGLRLLYDKEAMGYHYHIVTLEGAIRRGYQRGLNWGQFRELAAEPEISVKYHVFNSHVFKDYVYTFTHPNNLIGADKNPLLLFIRMFSRVVLFNFLTVRYFWLPLMALAERNRMIAKLMHWQFYRGVVSYHFFKGVGEGYKKYAAVEGASI